MREMVEQTTQHTLINITEEHSHVAKASYITS